MTASQPDRVMPAMAVDAATEPFLAACREGVLKFRRCTACGQPHWYPRPVCPFCQGDTVWEEASGTGEIYSVTVTRRAGPVPYALAYVRLDEGVTMMTNIVDGDLDALRIGQRVQVLFRPDAAGNLLPVFRPA